MIVLARASSNVLAIDAAFEAIASDSSLTTEYRRWQFCENGPSFKILAFSVQNWPIDSSVMLLEIIAIT